MKMFTIFCFPFSIFSGKYDIHVDNKLVGNYEETGSFGELALMYNMPRAATIIATTDGTLWAMVSELLKLSGYERKFHNHRSQANL